MTTFFKPSTLVATILVSVLAFGTVGCGNKTASNQQAAHTAGQGTALGDLSTFKTIAEDVAKLVNQGQLPQAKTRIKDLESAWDSAEAGIKPRAADDWHTLDKAIDHALSALRADNPTQADCNAAMTQLLHTFDELQPAAKR